MWREALAIIRRYPSAVIVPGEMLRSWYRAMRRKPRAEEVPMIDHTGIGVEDMGVRPPSTTRR